jgi:hypothetical protein
MERLGYSSMQELREHPFFKDVDFEKLDKQEIDIPLLDFFQELSRPEVTLNTEMDDDEDISQSITMFKNDQSCHAAVIQKSSKDYRIS